MSAFDRYAPFVQDYIYRNHWENLRAIQVAAADAIFNTDDNVSSLIGSLNRQTPPTTLIAEH